MAYPAGTYRNKLTFKLGTAGEIAVITLSTRYSGPEGEPFVTDHINSHVASKWGTGFNSLKTKFAPTVVLDHMDTYSLDPAGHALTKATTVFDGVDEAVWAGLSTAASLPWECAVVITLDGNTGGYDPHAARKRGRFYLPPPSADVLNTDNSGMLVHSFVDSICTGAHNWIEAVNDIPSGLSNQCRTVVSSKVGGYNTDVAFVRCDEKVDAQRRRENREGAPYRKDLDLTP